MVSNIQYAYCIAIIVSFVSTAYAIQCNECESNLYTKCNDPFGDEKYFQLNCDLRDPPKYLQDLSPGVRLEATGCMKKTFKFNENAQVVLRSCYWGGKNTKTGCQDDPMRPYLTQLSCNICDTDLCNSSTATGPISAAAFALFVVLIRMMS